MRLQSVLSTARHLRSGFGRAGENIVDNYFQNIGWTVEARNRLVSGGEIDRIFNRLANDGLQTCYAEIKTRRFQNIESLQSLTTERGLSSILRARQVRILMREAEHRRLKFPRQPLPFIRIFILCFLIQKDHKSTTISQAQQLKVDGFKTLWQTPAFVLLSFEPQWCQRGGAGGSLVTFL